MVFMSKLVTLIPAKFPLMKKMEKVLETGQEHQTKIEQMEFLVKFEDSLFHLATSIHLLGDTMVKQAEEFQKIGKEVYLQAKVHVPNADLMRELLTDSQFSPTNI
jgi:hypothetical protein